jgi:hypothetical protein
MFLNSDILFLHRHVVVMVVSGGYCVEKNDHFRVLNSCVVEVLLGVQRNYVARPADCLRWFAQSS